MANQTFFDFRDRVAAISGGASGIGLATARRLASNGATVALWDINEDALALAARSFPDPTRVRVHTVDVTHAAAAAEAAERLAREFDRIDILVACAGITGPTVPAWEYPLDAWAAVMRINMDGVMHCCRAVVPHMLRGHYGRIVNVGSIGGKEGNPCASAYAASKGAVVAFTKSLGKELANTGVRANSICPAVIETELLKQMEPAFVQGLLAKIPMGRFGRVEEVAAMITWMCSEECSFCTGAVFDASGGRATY